MAYLPALITAGAALLVLLIMARVLLVSVRRFRSELAGYRARLDAETSILQAGSNELRGRLDHFPRLRWVMGWPRPDKYHRQLGETEDRHG